MPAFFKLVKIAEQKTHSQLVVAVCIIVGFMIPLLFSIADVKFITRKWREEGFFSGHLGVSSAELRQFYIPAWIRMGVLFVAAVASTLVLKTLGIDF